MKGLAASHWGFELRGLRQAVAGRAAGRIALGLVLAIAACSRDKASTEPEAGANLLGPMASGSADSTADGGGELGGGSSELVEGEKYEPPPRKELPKVAAPVERCSGKGKNRECKMVDPKPKVSASHGIAVMMGDFRWGMTPNQAFAVLTADIEKEYQERLKNAKDAMSQDAAHQWRRDQLQTIKSHHTKFKAAGRHRWGVSLIANEFADDNNEEMLWVQNDNGLKKYYFFKDGELWKIFYAYPTSMWPGQDFEAVVDERFKKWFGPSPEAKIKADTKTAEPLLRYYEWTSMDNEKVRAYDMTGVHGVIALALVNGDVESRLGERLPATEKKDDYSDVVQGVLGGSDVCYDKSGDVVECAEK